MPTKTEDLTELIEPGLYKIFFLAMKESKFYGIGIMDMITDLRTKAWGYWDGEETEDPMGE